VPEGNRLGRARRLAILAGLLSGLIAFGIGEESYELIQAEKVSQNLMGSIVMVSNRATTTVADTRNAAVAFAELGVCLGACLGVAGGLARRSGAGAVTGGLLGVFLGLALGAGASLALLPWFIKARYDYFQYDLAIALTMHVTIWGLLGAAEGPVRLFPIRPGHRTRDARDDLGAAGGRGRAGVRRRAGGIAVRWPGPCGRLGRGRAGGAGLRVGRGDGLP
jgi:hypothetical protein